MKPRTLILLLLWFPLLTTTVQAETAGASQEAPRSTTLERAVVEEVLSANRGKYLYRDYIVQWHGRRVAVTNPFAISRHTVGDTIPVFAARRNVDGNPGLWLLNIEARVSQPGDMPPPENTHESFMDTGSGTVEEVLTANDESFRYVAYIVKWGDSRIAIADKAGAHFAVGNPIEFVIYGMGGANNPSMSFLLMPKRAQPTQNSITTSKEVGTIDEVLVARAEGGYDYRAYVVSWRGVHVALQDYTGSPHVSGETLAFLLERVRQGDGGIAGHLRLDPGAAVDDDEVRSRLSGITTTQSTEVAVVDEVIESTVDGVRYVSYLVHWHGQRVAVNDYYAFSHYAPKDQVSFTVTENADRSGKTLSFDILSASPPQSSVSKGKP